MPRYIEIKAPDGSVYKVSSMIGDEIEKVHPALWLGAYKYYQLTTIERYPEDVAREMSIESIREYAIQPCPEYLVKLFSATKKREQEKLLKGQIIKPADLLSWFLRAGIMGGLFSQYSYEDDGGNLKGRVPLLVDATDNEHITTIGKTNLSQAALKHLVDNQKKVIAQLIDFEDGSWHCFYRTFKGLSGRESGEQGSHMHYISSAYGLPRQSIVDGFKKGICPRNGYHIRFESNYQRRDKL